MNTKVILVVVVVLVTGALAYVALKPEPTPQDRLEKAAEQAGDAAKEGAEAISDAAAQTGDAIAEKAEASAGELAAGISETAAALAKEVDAVAQETRDALKDLIGEWRASGVATDDGIDFEKAIAAVEESDMNSEAKSQAKAILQFLRDAPGEAAVKLAELETALSG